MHKMREESREKLVEERESFQVIAQVVLKLHHWLVQSCRATKQRCSFSAATCYCFINTYPAARHLKPFLGLFPFIVSW